MARASEGNEQLLCSFCGKSQRQVKKLIAGPGVYICDECIDKRVASAVGDGAVVVASVHQALADR